MNKLEQAAQALVAHWDTPAWKYLKPTGDLMADLREALAEPQITTPDVCGEVCARAKLCYGCNKDLEEANAKYAEQAEQEPVGYLYDYRQSGEVFSGVFTDDFEMVQFNYGYNIRPLYAAPVRTKDLTDDDLLGIWFGTDGLIEGLRAVIAADRELNK